MLTIPLVIAITKFRQRIDQLEYRLSQLERKVSFISQGKELDQQDQRSKIDQELIDLLAKGKKIAAIKRARETMGLSLAEAKDYVEHL